MTDLQTRIRWVDFVRAVAIFLVVVAHVQYSGNGSSWIWTAYYALTRIAVPLFFMISGYLLLSRNEGYSDFFKKRAVKVFVPFLIWSVIYLIWKQEALDQSLFEIGKTYFVKIIRGPRENHLWFFYELFGLYLFTPILRVYVGRATKMDFLYFCGIWFLFVPVTNLLREFTPVDPGFSYQFLGGYIGYFIFGYYAGTLDFKRNQNRIALGLFLGGFILTIVGMMLARSSGWKTQYFEDYMSVNVVLMSASAYILFIRRQVPDAFFPAVRLVSGASFGIYLAHVIVMKELFDLPIFSPLPSVGHSSYMIPSIGVIGFLSSLLLVVILQRIPVLKYTVP